MYYNDMEKGITWSIEKHSFTPSERQAQIDEISVSEEPTKHFKDINRKLIPKDEYPYLMDKFASEYTGKPSEAFNDKSQIVEGIVKMSAILFGEMKTSYAIMTDKRVIVVMYNK